MPLYSHTGVSYTYHMARPIPSADLCPNSKSVPFDCLPLPPTPLLLAANPWEPQVHLFLSELGSLLSCCSIPHTSEIIQSLSLSDFSLSLSTMPPRSTPTGDGGTSKGFMVKHYSTVYVYRYTLSLSIHLSMDTWLLPCLSYSQ